MSLGYQTDWYLAVNIRWCNEKGNNYFDRSRFRLHFLSVLCSYTVRSPYIDLRKEYKH